MLTVYRLRLGLGAGDSCPLLGSDPHRDSQKVTLHLRVVDTGEVEPRWVWNSRRGETCPWVCPLSPGHHPEIKPGPRELESLAPTQPRHVWMLCSVGAG